MTSFNIVLYGGFETLDAFGPAEVIGQLPQDYSLKFHSLNGGIVVSSQQVPVDTLPFAEMDQSGILLIPGGFGARKLVIDENYVEQLKLFSEKAPYVLTVCTGSALLAKTNLLNGMKATSNKMVFEWVCSNGTEVNWIKKARWVKDGKYYTAAGISAGIDMLLGFVSDMHGVETAQTIANYIEYIWNSDMDNDPFGDAVTD
ncbi:MAG: DJ-1/PfpI family protein [Synergistaceae bacterium]|nr:DJ-1/PfpI family protein [Synergistaceae bacterium]